MNNSKAKMDEFKSKFMDLLNKQNRPMIPSMGFSDYFVQSIAPNEKATGATSQDEEDKSAKEAVHSDQEILESIEEIYFESDTEPATYELKKVCESDNFEIIDETMAKLRKQHKILSKQVLQNILNKRSLCNAEFATVVDIQKKLEESLWTCRKARSYLNFAKNNLTTTSLEILASYRKREIIKELLEILNAIKVMKSTDVGVQNFLKENDFPGAISLILKCKKDAASYMEFHCVQSLDKKLQETLLMTEFQMDTVLNEMILNFDARIYAKLMEAYKLLNKSLIAMDQLHINFISTIHSIVNSVLRGYNEPETAEENVKMLYEQLCEKVTTEKYIPCLVSLCKTTWTILASYYQIVGWHQNYKLYSLDTNGYSPDIDIEEKLQRGQSRIWNDILAKICIYLQTLKISTLKYDQFIQILSIAQRLKKVGIEFCGAQSEKLIETMQTKSEEFFQRYHLACLEEVCLFLDNESWSAVDSVTHILNLPEFRTVRHMFLRQKTPPVATLMLSNSTAYNSSGNNNCDEVASIHSQDGGSSIYGSYGYFLRFSEKSSPFDGGLDSTMLEEDILSGIIDEASCYFSEESDEEQKSLPHKYDSENLNNGPIIVTNTTLNVFRCIGRYLQMCKLLHSISPKIVGCMLELMDFYVYAVFEIFGKDAPVPMEKLLTSDVEEKLQDVKNNILINIKMWPLNFTSLINNELANPDTLYGLHQRVLAIESVHVMINQFQTLQSYLNHLLPASEKHILTNYLSNINYLNNIGSVIFTCVTSRVLDLPTLLAMMSKVKWDVNVSSQNNSYVDVMNRSIQNFAMQLEEIEKAISLPTAQIWNSMAHVVMHLLVEGFSNAKKCSPSGRALMQLDFTCLMSYLELISKQKFPDYHSYVDGFIKAYYLTNEQFSEWIESQLRLEQYSKKQLTNLIQIVAVNDKKLKQKLLNLVGNNTTNLNVSSGSGSSNALNTNAI